MKRILLANLNEDVFSIEPRSLSVTDPERKEGYQFFEIKLKLETLSPIQRKIGYYENLFRGKDVILAVDKYAVWQKGAKEQESLSNLCLTAYLNSNVIEEIPAIADFLRNNMYLNIDDARIWMLKNYRKDIARINALSIASFILYVLVSIIVTITISLYRIQTKSHFMGVLRAHGISSTKIGLSIGFELAFLLLIALAFSTILAVPISNRFGIDIMIDIFDILYVFLFNIVVFPVIIFSITKMYLSHVDPYNLINYRG